MLLSGHNAVWVHLWNGKLDMKSDGLPGTPILNINFPSGAIF